MTTIALVRYQGWLREQLGVPPGPYCYTLTACQGGGGSEGEDVDWEEQSRTALATIQVRSHRTGPRKGANRSLPLLPFF